VTAKENTVRALRRLRFTLILGPALAFWVLLLAASVALQLVSWISWGDDRLSRPVYELAVAVLDAACRLGGVSDQER
jgi:hypothetical protein